MKNTKKNYYEVQEKYFSKMYDDFLLRKLAQWIGSHNGIAGKRSGSYQREPIAKNLSNASDQLLLPNKYLTKVSNPINSQRS